MSCARLRPWIAGYVEGELSPRATLKLARHVDRCTSCRILVARERRLGEILDGMEDSLEVDASFLERVMAALPERAVRTAVERNGRERWRRGLKLAGTSAIALIGAGTLARLAPALRLDLSAPALPRFTPESANGWLGVLGSTVQWVRITAESLGWSGDRPGPGVLPDVVVAGILIAIVATIAVASAAWALAPRALPRWAGGRAPNGASPASPRA